MKRSGLSKQQPDSSAATPMPAAHRSPTPLMCVITSLLILIAVASKGSAANIAAIYARAGQVNAELFFRADDRTTYVSTGDIDAMWLRDSSVQAMSRLSQQALVRGVIFRQERLIAIDPYANAFHRDYQVAERKFELDSLCYPVRLAEQYVHATGDTSVYDHRMYGELHIILHTMLIEQQHTHRSHYHQNERAINDGIGLVWSAYRPSDDPQTFNYNIPENMFAATTLREMALLFSNVYHDESSAHKAAIAAERIEQAIESRAVFATHHGRIYAYEIDGLGRAKFMDDANVPSLLSIPLLGYAYNARAYAATRAYVLSPGNPYYYRGRFASGVGSLHTPSNYVWPMSLIMEYRTARDHHEQQRVISELALSNAGDGLLHESFDVNDPRRYTRPRFGWVNALFEQTFLTR
ncbi:MAG: glycoside hydrolase family 125 protein [Candidatus Eremiobacteraeota bacterium]|nr:glycoside hydrolase family 125 protein [Candidatus Eremiobacteraeota bacterium]